MCANPVEIDESSIHESNKQSKKNVYLDICSFKQC